jgi:hypothetical protein
MRLTKREISKVLDRGDIVYAILPKGGYKEAVVEWIDEDSLYTDLDVLFYDEIGENWCLCESTAKNITRKSQKNVL